MAKTEKMFKTIDEFCRNMHTLEEDVLAEELKKYSAIERQNILATEWIEAGIYPASKFSRKNMLRDCLRIDGKIFWPIVGWDPDVAPLLAEGKIPPLRKWLNSRQVRHLRVPSENRTYTLYY